NCADKVGRTRLSVYLSPSAVGDGLDGRSLGGQRRPSRSKALACAAARWIVFRDLASRFWLESHQVGRYGVRHSRWQNGTPDRKYGEECHFGGRGPEALTDGAFCTMVDGLLNPV